MMAKPLYQMQSLQLIGFRAFLKLAKFDFSNKRCLAIFAPNGWGKSSIIDALEFMFSKDGTLDRLGIKNMNNQAGVVALAHNLAEAEKITPAVTISFVSGKDVTSGKRVASGNKRQIPEIGAKVNSCFKVSPIVRGYALRTFVESHSPEQRYTDVATWLQLEPLVDVQKNLRALRAKVKDAAHDTGAFKSVDCQLANETDGTLDAWDDNVIVEFVNESILAPLDKTLNLKALDAADSSYVELLARLQVEEQEVGLADLRQIRTAAAELWDEDRDKEGGELITTGTIPAFEAATMALLNATEIETNERDKAASSVFRDLWIAAEPLFTEAVPDPETCPVCATPISETTAGTIMGIRAHIAARLEKLGDYSEAKKTLDNAKDALGMAHSKLATALTSLQDLLTDDHAVLKKEILTYRNSFEICADGETPASETLVSELKALLTQLDCSISEIQAKHGEHTYAKSRKKIDRLLELQTERASAQRKHVELKMIAKHLDEHAATISGKIREQVQALLDTLQMPMNEIYKQIQGAAAKPIRLELATEDDTNQQRLYLEIEFADNRPRVRPSGYLSDSQIHSVALALKLAAVKQFNQAAPILALDDIVTSYDADHRRTIAGLLATMFRNCQIIIATHDERFFNYLKDQLEAKDWQFKRIIKFDPAYGPRFADHKVSDEMIKERWDEGQSAANEMRQAEEEWLLGICRGFSVNIRIRQLEKAYSYERSELAEALARFLKNVNLNPQPIAGVNNRFLTSLQKGEIENFGSHFQDGLYGASSIGDECARWKEFKAFREQFVCPKCSRTRFKRSIDFKKPVCAHQGCEAQFAFIVPTDPTPDIESIT